MNAIAKRMTYVLLSLSLTVFAGTGCKKKDKGGPAPSGEQVSPSQALTLTVSKTGNGTVTSSPSGINCGTDCSESFSPGTQTTLAAQPDSFSQFMGWGGGNCSGIGNCVRIIQSSENVSARFDHVPFDGTFDGLNSQGRPFSLKVSQDAVSEFSIQVRIQGNFCSVTYTKTVTYMSSFPQIQSNSFSDATGGNTITGTFSSLLNVSGSVSIYDSICDGTATVSFSASKSAGPAPAFLSLSGGAQRQIFMENGVKIEIIRGQD